jgi:hypothetical protein
MFFLILNKRIYTKILLNSCKIRGLSSKVGILTEFPPKTSPVSFIIKILNGNIYIFNYFVLSHFILFYSILMVNIAVMPKN